TAVARDAAGKQATSAPVAVTVAASTSSGNSTFVYSLSDKQVDAMYNTDASAPMSVGYAVIQPDSGYSALDGAAIFSYHSADGVVVSEASIPISPLRQSGRFYVEVQGPTNTGVAFANPNDQDAVISFYFTDTSGHDFGNGSFKLGAKRQLAAFL